MQGVISCPKCAAKMGVISHTPGSPVLCPRCQTNFVPGAAASPARIPAAELLSLDEADAPRSRTPVVVAAAVALAAVVGVGAYFALREKPRGVAPEVVEVPKTPPSAEPTRTDPPAAVVAPPASVVITETPRTAEQVNYRLLKSTVWIAAGNSIGSGSLVHQQRGLVITNYHVVGKESNANVFFAAFDANQELITDPNHYVKHRDTLRVRGTVVSRDARADLALIRLDRVPDSAPGVPLATKAAPTGASIYSIGASGVDSRGGDLGGALWRFSTGSVRGRYRHRVVFSDQTIDAWILETQKPINSGDSGGPTVNDRGELVGVVSMSKNPLKGNLLMWDIDLVEVRTFLTGYAKRDGWVWNDREAAPPAAGQDPATVTQLIARIRNEKGDAQLYAVRQLGAIGPDAKAGVPILIAAANPSSAELEAAIAAALARIGPPESGADEALVRAIGSKSIAVRTYAVRCVAAGATVPDAAVGALVAALGDASAEVRLAAAIALGVAGAKAKAAALLPLLDRADDADPKVAAAAAHSLGRFAPLEEADKPALASKLSDKSAGVRKAAARWVTPLVTTPDEAYTLWFPLLTDVSSDLRVLGLTNLSKHPTAFSKVGVTVVGLLADPEPSVRLAAVTHAAALKGTGGLEARIAKMLADDPSPEVRAAAASTAAAVAEADADNLPLLRQLLQTNSAAARRVAAEKLAALKTHAAPAADELVGCVGDADADVSAAAIRALLAVGRDGQRGCDAVSKTFANARAAEPVLAAAADFLAAADAGLPVLKDARARTLPPQAVLAMCRRFGRTGDADLLRWMIEQAVEVETCRAVVTAALEKYAADEHVRELIERTYSIKPRRQGEPERRATVESRRWALDALTRIDTGKVSLTTREKLADRVRALSAAVGASEKELAAEAAAFSRRLKP